MMGRLVLCLLLLVAGCGGRETPRRTTDFKVILLGFDGVDPGLVQEWLDELPSIRRLARDGTLTELGTTNPPESPVAWASFATGLNPGKHGIYDFLRRDPETYFPEIGLVSIEPARFLFGVIPLRGPRVINNRRGVTFWRHLDAHGVSTVNLRMPLEFPPQPLERGATWSGLSVPDIRGTWGAYFYLATDLTQWDLSDTEFGGRLVRLEPDGEGICRVSLDGPVDPRSRHRERLEIPIEIVHDAETGAEVTIRIQGQEQSVAEGTWSDWFRFRFSLGPLVNLSDSDTSTSISRTGPETEHSGDIQLTFRSGYRTSWQTSLGAVPANIVVANLKKWSGDHCASDPSDTAGFLVSNRRIVTVDPHLIDMAPTLYRVFGAPIPEPVDGRPLEWLP